MLDRLLTLPPGLFSFDGKRLNKGAYIFLIILCLAFFLPGFVSLPPTDRDESLFAQASKQMIETNNYVDIRFQKEPRYKKPVGIYWLQAASVKLFNPNHLDEIWAYRIPSLIGAIVAVVMTAALGALLFGPAVGLLGAIMMAGCFILNVEARLAKTDAALLGSIMVAQYAMARAYIGYGTRPLSRGVFFAFWTAIGVGILLKGPIIFLVIFSTLLWLWISERNLKWFLSLKPLGGLLFALLIAAPWFAAIMLASKGQFLPQSAGHDLFAKLWEAQGHKATPFGVYFLAMPFTFFPFGLWVLMSAADSWKNRKKPAVRFCLGWIIPAWLVFEMAFTKLPHYVLPLYPPLALLAAKALMDGYPRLAEARRWRWLPVVSVGIWLITGVGLMVAAACLPYIMDHAWNRGLIAAAALVLIAMISSLLFYFRKKENGVLMMTAASLIFITTMFAGALPYIQHLWVSPKIVELARTLDPCPNRPLKITSSYNEPSLVFLAGTETYIENNGDLVAQSLQLEPCRVGVVSEDAKQNFLNPFTNSSNKPEEVGTLEGMDPGRGRITTLTFYVMPPAARTP